MGKYFNLGENIHDLTWFNKRYLGLTGEHYHFEKQICSQKKNGISRNMSNQFPIYKMNTWWNSLNRNFSFLLSGAMAQLGLKNITSLWLLMRKNVYVSLFHRDRVKNFHHWDSDCKSWICLIKKQLLFISRIALQEAIALPRECGPNLRKRSNFANEKER